MQSTEGGLEWGLGLVLVLWLGLGLVLLLGLGLVWLLGLGLEIDPRWISSSVHLITQACSHSTGPQVSGLTYTL